MNYPGNFLREVDFSSLPQRRPVPTPPSPEPVAQTAAKPQSTDPSRDARAAVGDSDGTPKPYRDREGAEAGYSTPGATPSQNEPTNPVAAEACPAADPQAQTESVPLHPPQKKSRAEAARENGRKSRGPITPEGKARSSQNALKHGLSARHVVIGSEEEDEWWEFRDECREALRPVGAVEISYADEFAASRWRLQRCLGIETTIFDYEFAHQENEPKKYKVMDNVARTGLAFKSAKEDLNALGRYESRIRRAGERALTALLKLRSLRPNEPNDPPLPDGDMRQLVPSGAESSATNEPNAPQTPDAMLRVPPPADKPRQNEPNPNEETRHEPHATNPAKQQNEPNAPHLPDSDMLQLVPSGGQHPTLDTDMLRVYPPVTK